VTRATQLTGTKLLGQRIVVESSQAEKNREYASLKATVREVIQTGGKRVKIQNLHKDINVDMLKDIFKPFGSITECTCGRDESTRSLSHMATITYSTAQAAKNCTQQMNGFKLAEMPLRITQLLENSALLPRAPVESDLSDKGGVNLGKTGRYELMTKLANGANIPGLPRIPRPQTSNWNKPTHPPMPSNVPSVPSKIVYNTMVEDQKKPASLLNVPTQCLVISNFFDPKKTLADEEVQAIKDEVIDQLIKFGGCYHISVDQSSLDGNVYVKTQTVSTAISAISTFEGKVYKNRTLSVVYLPVATYHSLFPEAADKYTLLSSSKQLLALN